MWLDTLDRDVTFIHFFQTNIVFGSLSQLQSRQTTINSYTKWKGYESTADLAKN